MSVYMINFLGSRDEWTFMLGGESEKMKELTDEILSYFDSGGDG